MDEVLYGDHADMEVEHWWFQGRRAVVKAVPEAHLAPSHRPAQVLDVGCGTGDMLLLLAEFADNVTGIDMSPDAAALAQAPAPAPAGATARAGRIPDDIPQDGSLDLVTAFDAVEHIDDDVAALVFCAARWTRMTDCCS